MRSKRSRRKLSRGLVANLRKGRIQRALAATVAGSAVPIGAEIWFEHYRGSFGDKWMWTPIFLTPPLAAAGIAGFYSERAAKTALPVVSALYALDGLIGVITHIRGVRRKPGGFQEPLYNIVMGPPALAPGSLVLIGGLGLLAPLVPRER
ncbi:MAG: hypothetical protein WKF62_02700 [Solirubrobacterales bacterium]